MGDQLYNTCNTIYNACISINNESSDKDSTIKLTYIAHNIINLILLLYATAISEVENEPFYSAHYTKACAVVYRWSFLQYLCLSMSH